MRTRLKKPDCIAFERRDAQQDWPSGPFDIVSVIDVMHHVPTIAQRTVIERAASRLKPGGLLVYKDMVERPRWRAWKNRLHDLVLARQWTITHPCSPFVIGCAPLPCTKTVEFSLICSGTGTNSLSLGGLISHEVQTVHRKCSFPSPASPRLASSQAFAKIGVGCYRHFSGLAQLHDSSGPVKCNFSILQGRLGCNFDTASSRRTPFDHSEAGLSSSSKIQPILSV